MVKWFPEYLGGVGAEHCSNPALPAKQVPATNSPCLGLAGVNGRAIRYPKGEHPIRHLNGLPHFNGTWTGFAFGCNVAMAKLLTMIPINTCAGGNCRSCGSFRSRSLRNNDRLRINF